MALPHDDTTNPQTAQEGTRQMTQLASRLAWEEVMGANNPSPVKYDKTSVLILGWAEDADDTKTAEELVPLQEVLEGDYGFPVQYKRMHMKEQQKHPQLQATKHVVDFVYEQDGPGGLLIVYYAGHGWAERTSKGRLLLRGRFPENETEKDMSIDWSEVEHTLGKTRSDVLVMFDCCHAGLLCCPAFRGPERSFYYVAACRADQKTYSSGDRSFTAAMIWALKKLSDSPGFTVTTLISTLMEHKPFPRDKQEVMICTDRFGPGHEIWIAPSPANRVKGVAVPTQKVSPSHVKPTADFLDLRFHFEDHATAAHIKETALALKKFLESKRSLRFHRISFIDHTSLVEWLARRWLDRMRKRGLANEVAPPVLQQPSNLALFHVSMAFNLLLQRCRPVSVWHTSASVVVM